MFRKILIANRGEVALRIARACRELGVRSVAVYSDADRVSPHVLFADEAYRIGAPASAESYLRGDRMIDVARRAGCDAIHPGYGFLAENAEFAAAVEAAGLTFIGPPADAIAAMGEKTEARRRMAAAGVPIVPGGTEAVDDAHAAERAARELGYPVMLKAAAGGGGKGMRIVEARTDIAAAFDAASREAMAAFGDGSIYVEKYLERPRHVEIQVLADSAGNVIHLGERECSIQRRHQKLIEESPSPAIDDELRSRMGAAAVAAAAAVGYRNTGTVEFLVVGREFFFLEMNTRIQVEHPVTELVTGMDLVQWQIRLAAGETLPWSQVDIAWRGHALECRITAEDAANGFLPSTGRVEHLAVPTGPGVRWDGGICAGFDVSPFYDPLLGKLIVHAEDRGAAISRMARCLDEMEIVGVETSTALHRRIMDEPNFRAGRYDVQYLDRHPELFGEVRDDDSLRAAALAVAMLEDQRSRRGSVRRIPPRTTPGWNAWRSGVWR